MPLLSIAHLQTKTWLNLLAQIIIAYRVCLSLLSVIYQVVRFVITNKHVNMFHTFTNNKLNPRQHVYSNRWVIKCILRSCLQIFSNQYHECHLNWYAVGTIDPQFHIHYSFHHRNRSSGYLFGKGIQKILQWLQHTA